MAFLEIALVFLVIFVIWWVHRSPPNFPPGPTGIPFLGYAPLMFSKELLHVCAAKERIRFGSVFAMPMGLKGHALILNDWKSMKEAIIQQGDVFAGRPDSFLMNVCFGKVDIVSAQGPLWRDKRRFSLHHLRDFGFAKNSMESIIVEEVENVLALFESKHGSVIDCEASDFLFMPILNIIWGIVSGKKYAMDDERMLKFSKTLQMFFQDFQELIFLNVFSLLRFLPGCRPKFLRLTKNRDVLLAFLRADIAEHAQTYVDGTARDFIDVYLSEIYKQKDSAKPNPAFEVEHLLGAILDFFGAGVETTKNTLMWGFLYMVTWPEIQEKVQQEMDSVIGKERIPRYSDRPHLPYTEAVLLEIQRYATIVPFSVPHSTMKETTLMGYAIPKDTFVLQNVWAVHNDKKTWGDPEVFRPERFLNAEGKVEKPEYLIPFSTGPRECLGEPLAKMELFLFFAAILQRFYLRLPTGIKPPGLDPLLSISLRPQPYSLSIRRRF